MSPPKVYHRGMVRFREQEFTATQAAVAINSMLDSGGVSGEEDLAVMGGSQHEPLPRVSCEEQHVQHVMHSFQGFGESIVWTCVEHDELYGLMQVFCEQFPTGVWILVHDFLEEHLCRVAKHLMSEGDALKKHAPLFGMYLVEQNASSRVTQVALGILISIAMGKFVIHNRQMLMKHCRMHRWYRLAAGDSIPTK